MYTRKSVDAQLQKRGCTKQELRDYILRQEQFYKQTADARITFARWIQPKLGCSWLAAETVIRWAKKPIHEPIYRTSASMRHMGRQENTSTE